MTRTLLKAWALVCLAAVLALLTNRLRGMPIRPGEVYNPDVASLTVVQAAALLSTGAVFLDARPQPAYLAAHIPGAVPAWHLSWRSRPKTTVFVVYCASANCDQYRPLVRALLAEGFTRVMVMPAGLKGWVEAGYPHRTGSEP